MGKARLLLRSIPKSEKDLFIFELRRQKSYWLFNALMNTNRIKKVSQLIKSLNFYDTEHGFDFWCRIYHREITPKWVRKEMGYDN